MLIAAWRFQIIGQVLEDQALIKRMEGSGQVRKVIGRADDQAVGFPDRVQYRRQAVTAYTVPFESFFFTAEAGNAAGVSLQAEKIESFSFSTGALCASYGFFDQCIGIPAFARAGIDRDDFFCHRNHPFYARKCAARRTDRDERTSPIIYTEIREATLQSTVRRVVVTSRFKQYKNQCKSGLSSTDEWCLEPVH